MTTNPSGHEHNKQEWERRSKEGRGRPGEASMNLLRSARKSIVSEKVTVIALRGGRFTKYRRQDGHLRPNKPQRRITIF